MNAHSCNFLCFTAAAHPTKSRSKEPLRRHAPVRKRKQYVANGHRFVAQQFYQIMKCAFCNDYLMTGGGFRCEACSYLCHQRCYQKVVIKCISRIMEQGEVPEEQFKVIRHNVPHHLVPFSGLVPTWCTHCGYMMPLGKKQAGQRCSECPITCHADCGVYIPNFCGMSMDVANQLISQAQEVETNRQQALLRPSTTTNHRRDRISMLENDLLKSRASPISQSTGAISHDPLRSKTFSLDDFNFIAVLGKGNFGKVMLAEEKATKLIFAIKVLKKEFILENDEIESTRSEKRVFLAVNRERHPFLVGLHSCFQTDTRIYFVMEYVSGGDLMLHIQRQQFSEMRARFYACEVLLALEYFHKNDIIYRLVLVKVADSCVGRVGI